MRKRRVADKKPPGFAAGRIYAISGYYNEKCNLNTIFLGHNKSACDFIGMCLKLYIEVQFDPYKTQYLPK